MRVDEGFPEEGLRSGVIPSDSGKTAMLEDLEDLLKVQNSRDKMTVKTSWEEKKYKKVMAQI